MSSALRPRLHARHRPGLAAADAFFVYVDCEATPQLLGGVVVINHDDTDASGYRDRLTAVIRAHLAELPRFRQRIVVPQSRWCRPRWARSGGRRLAVAYSVAQSCRCRRQPRRRVRAEFACGRNFSPPRCRWTVRPGGSSWATGFAPRKIAAILIVHHAVGDGLQILAQTGALLEPTAGVGLPAGDRPGFGRRALGTVIGLVQLATDGRNHHLLPSGERAYGSTRSPCRSRDLRDAAHAHRASVTDVLLSATAGALSRLLDPGPPTALG